MPDPTTLATVASVIAAFGSVMLIFRIQREIDMHAAGEVNWIPRSDWLLVAATLTALLIVLLPEVLFADSRLFGRRIPTAGCAAALVGIAGYIPALLAHYRLLFGSGRTGPRLNPEPAEQKVFVLTWAAAFGVFFLSLVLTA